LLDKDNPDVYAYTRTGEGEKILVLLNFKAQDATINIGTGLAQANILVSNYNAAPAVNMQVVKLRPYEAAIYNLPF
jgi:oligo-1,6-glucosidase